MPQNRNTGGSGDYGARDNDVSGSQRSFGQNRDQNPKANERSERGGHESAKERRGEKKNGVPSEEVRAILAKITNIEAFLKTKMGYDPKANYAKEKPEEAKVAAPVEREDPNKLLRRPIKLPRFSTDY